MAFELNLRAPFGEQLREFSELKVRQATNLLSVANGDADEAVHDTRKLMKRLRALLRLIRSVLTKQHFQTLDKAAADTSRCLSGPREARATLDCLATVVPDLLLVLPDDTVHRLGQVLEDTLLESSLEDTLNGARAHLAHLAEAFADVAWEAVSLEQALDGLAVTYKRARRSHKTCEESSHAEVFHDLRKGVKHHTHQLQLFRDLWPAWVEAHGETARTLGDLLGSDHDLSDLQLRLIDGRLGLSPQERLAVEGVLRARSQLLRAEASPLRARLFAESARAFRKRTGAYARTAST